MASPDCPKRFKAQTNWSVDILYEWAFVVKDLGGLRRTSSVDREEARVTEERV
jgi:hypothetical protein